MTEFLNGSHWQLPTFDLYEFATRKTDFCVCIPVINEGERIRNELVDMVQHRIAGNADILILDGGSTDGSMDHGFLRAQGVRTLLVKTSAGKLSAQLRMGYAYAMRQGYRGVVTIDGNGKDNVDAIPVFIRAMGEGWDLLQGSRFVPGGKGINTPISRYLAIRLIHAPLLRFATGFPYTDTTNGYRGYSARLLLDFRVQPFRNVFETYELLAYLSVRATKLGFKVKEIPVTRRYPFSGKTPTKIRGIRENMKLIGILLNAVRGKYDP